MGQKVHPLGFRVGVYEDWDAHWFAKKGVYGPEALEDIRIRQFLKTQLSNADVARIVIDKAGDSARVIVHSARPGVVIGKKGQGIEHLKLLLQKKFNKNIDVSVQEVRTPDLNPRIIANSIAEQIAKRVNYKKLMKKAGFTAMKAGARGIKICCAGRLAGAEIARTEWLRLGSIPLHTLRANVGYAYVESHTTYGVIGVKVWVCTGEYTKAQKTTRE